MKTILAYLKLMRPANIITAIADILMGFAAGCAVAGIQIFDQDSTLIDNLIWLVLASSGLYGGGVVFNDVFDAELDKIERPERPIPSGKASENIAILLGVILLTGGMMAAAQVSIASLILASLIAVLALIYDSISKHHFILGPINMGTCRGLNLLLGVSCIQGSIPGLWPISLIPLLYIAAITLISQGEVHGGNPIMLKGAFMLYILVLVAIFGLSSFSPFKVITILPFMTLFCILVFPPLLKSIRTLNPIQIRLAVKSGILALIVLNATIAAGFAGWLYGLLILGLLPVSILIAKGFSVT